MPWPRKSAVGWAFFIWVAAALQAQTVYTWNSGDILSGSITPTGTSTIGSLDTLNIVTTANHDFSGYTVTNNGTVNWNAGLLRSGGGGNFQNNATVNDSASGAIFSNNFGGGLTFTNAATGVYHKTAGDTTFGVGFVNQGVIDVSGGIFNLAGGGTFQSGSTAGSSGGTLKLSGGVLTLAGSVTLTNFILLGGDLAGTATLASSTVDWRDGTMNNSDTTTIGSGSTLVISQVNDHDFSGHQLVNLGTVSWVAGDLRSGYGGVIANQGLWLDSSDTYEINNAFGGGSTTFINTASGTYSKTAGVTTLNVPLVTSGAVTVSGGTLNLNAGGTFYDGSSIGSSGGGVVQLTGGVLTGGGTGVFTAANFLLTGGQVAGNLVFQGTTTWTAADFNTGGTSTFAGGGTLTITGAMDHDFSSHTLVNQGTVEWLAGRIRSGYSGSITNHGTWHDTSNYEINSNFGGGSTTFVNAADGTYLKTAGSSLLNDGVLVNNGLVDVTGGTLSIFAGALNNGSTIRSSGGGVVQLTGGTMTANGTIHAQNFLINGGQLAGTQTWIGTVKWLTGDFNVSGTTTFDPTSTFTVMTAVDHNFSGHGFENYGTANWTDGRMRGGYGAIFTNYGTWNDTSSFAMNNDYGGPGGTTFLNKAGALYHKISGTSTLLDGVLVNEGTVSVTGGTLDLFGGALNNGSAIGSSGSGVVELVGGTLTASGTITVQQLQLNAGALTGTHAFSGTLSWNATDLNNSGMTTFNAGTTLTITGTADKNFSSRAIVNNGVVDWTAGRLRSGYGGSITNHGTWNDTAAGYAMNNDYGGPGGTTFNNASDGTYLKTSGTTSLLDGVLVNDGLISVSGGTLTLSGGTLNNNSTIGSSGSGLVQLTGGVLAAIGTITVQNFQLSGGQLTNSQTFQGSLTWNSTDLNTGFTTTFGAGGTFTIDTGSDHNFSSHAIVNNGTVNWFAGRLRSGYGGSITNNGVWNDTVSGSEVNNDYGGPGGTTFTNAAGGIYLKSAGATNFAVPVTNHGTIDVQGGAITLASTFTSSTGRVTVAGGATFSSASALTFAAGSQVNGAGTITAPSIAMSGEIAPGFAGSSGILTVTSSVTFLAGSQVTFGLGGTTVGSQYDQLAISGTTTLAGNLVVNFRGGFESTVLAGDTFIVLTSSGLTGVFANVANGSRVMTGDGYGSFIANYGAGSSFGTNYVVLSNFQPVPEPATWLLLLGGSGFLVLRFRRRRR